ncbi:hypothetical protein LSH36_242g03022 [Paralvinella palmiformis]|uniref:Arf-GAP with Rho-GAP domain, ANK repeat and PH domain-containing protein 1 n=1 Tax=Paralvinella palmiformis TaxID=53620 RepID=A0AAD9JNM8_9ANNE|nr:hypothetical protein LSH36_242g03022 [Paralvinella palmiformis]
MSTSVKEWLESLKLEQYLATLEEGGFDTVVKCASITASDLDRIGVTLTGHQLRILKYLPNANNVSQESTSASDFYDVPANLRNSMTEESEEVYENVDVEPPKPDLPPKRSDVDKDADRDWIDELVPSSAVRRLPIPKPRTALKKRPVPAPRSIRLKSPEISIGAFDEFPATKTTTSEIIAEEQKTEHHHKRKSSIKISGVTESETVLETAGEDSSSNTDTSDYITMDGGEEITSEISAAVVLSDEDLDYLENRHSACASGSNESAKSPLCEPNAKGSGAAMCLEKTSNSIVAESDETQDDLFNLKASFDAETPIPQSLSEWDEATIRKSLTMDTNLSADTSNPVSDKTIAGKTELLQPVDGISQLLPSVVHMVSTDNDSAIANRPVRKENTPMVVLEEEENKLNEALYGEIKKHKQAAGCDSSFYMSVWDMKSGINVTSVDPPFPEFRDMSPPRFSPPPPPQNIRFQEQLDHEQQSKPAPPKRDMIVPPELSKQNMPTPPIPERAKQTSAATSEAVSSPGLPICKQQHNTSAHGMNLMQPQTSSPVLIPTTKRNKLPPIPLVPQRIAPQPPDHLSMDVPHRRDKLTVVEAKPGSRESFTDLARDRIVSNKKTLSDMPSLPEQASIPQPPPKPGPSHFQNLRSMVDQCSEYEYIPGSPSAYDDIQSDDTLSDGGDWINSSHLPSKDVLKHAIPIIPAVQNKLTKKNGYLFKKASEETIRKMGGAWTKRWVTLNEKYLTYCSARKHSTTKRMIPVESILNIEQSIKSTDTHPYQFCVITVDRMYTFAADNADDMSVWSNVLMLDIMGCENTFVEGGEMYSPDKQGFIKVENVKQKRYFALKGDKLCYYNTLNDYRAGTPIGQIDLKVSVAKDLNRNRLQIVTATDSLILNMDTPEELNNWKKALDEAIAESLGEDSVLNEVYENHSNRLCADCQISGPQWASINMGITLCKHCAGIHRMLTIPVSKVKSLRMDSTVWTPALIKLMQVIGNDKANNFWQWNLKQIDNIDAGSTMSAREEHIKLKYISKQFCKLHPLKGDQLALNEALLKAVQYGDINETMQLLFTGADLYNLLKRLIKNYKWVESIHFLVPSDFEAAKTSIISATASSGLVSCLDIDLICWSSSPWEIFLFSSHLESHYDILYSREFLCQNGAQGSGQMPVTTSMVQEHMNVAASALISHKGYLYKTGSNIKEDFLKRWCVLDEGYLAYFENEKSITPRNKIGLKEMMSVAMTSDSRFQFSFDLATTRHSRVFLFAAELEEDRRKWVNLIAKDMFVLFVFLDHLTFDQAIAPVSQDLLSNVRDFSRAGVVYMKRGSSEGSGHFEKVDLRKVKSIKLVSNISETCRAVYEEGPMFVLNLYKDSSRTYNTLYLQGYIMKETETWHGLIQTLITKCGVTVEEQPLTDEDIPVIVDECINFVTLHGMKTCGIYRLNGQHSKVTKLLENFQKDAREQVLRLEEYNIHDVATVLKRFFRTLEEPLLLQSLYPKWLNTASIAERALKLEWYQYLVRELPTVSYCTLKKLILHLRRVADSESENRMGITNIASIFGPIVMSVDKDGDSGAGFATTSQEIAVFKDLMESSVNVFEVDDQELERENKMQAARKKMEEAMKMCTEKTKSVSQEMLLPVYMYSKDGQVFTLKVTSSTTAAELLKQVLQKCSLRTYKDVAIFECICNEELERPLHGSEKVLAVTLRWSKWPRELCKDNMLCVKENHVYPNIELVFDPHTALFSELKYCEKKGFKKYCFEFSHMQMSYKKDSRSTSILCSWNIEDLTVYLGIQQKRNPPTNWGFSFIKKDEKVQGSGRWTASDRPPQKLGQRPPANVCLDLATEPLDQ